MSLRKIVFSKGGFKDIFLIQLRKLISVIVCGLLCTFCRYMYGFNAYKKLEGILNNMCLFAERIQPLQ